MSHRQDIRSIQHEFWWFALIFLGALVLRVSLLHGKSVHLRSDEAVVGLMALDIARGARPPLFFPGQNYGGGHSVEAILMAPLISLVGPSELIVKSVPIIESLLLLVVVFLLVRHVASAYTALVSLTLLSFWAPFVAANFMVIGGMTTLLTGFLGLLLLLKANQQPHLPPAQLFLVGAALGFGVYCFGYGIYFLALALAYLIVLRHRTLLQELPGIIALGAGLVAGVAPLLLGRSIGSTSLLVDGLLVTPFRWHREPRRQLLAFFTRDLPSLFHDTVSDFPDHLSIWSWATFFLALALSFVALTAAGQPGKGWWAAWRERRPWVADRGEWIWIAAAALVLFALLYNLHPLAGTTPRYLLPVLPLLLLPSACGITTIAQRKRYGGIAVLVLVLALQAPLLLHFYRKGNQVEWGIKIDGEDIRGVVRYLEEHGYTTAVAPYELKYRISFLSNRRIIVAAHVFGFDRTGEDNAEAVRRVNAGAPFVMVLDREMRLPGIGQTLNQAEAFFPEVFFPSLRNAGITWEAVSIGNLVVLHRFTRHLLLPAAPEINLPASGNCVTGTTLFSESTPSSADCLPSS